MKKQQPNINLAKKLAKNSTKKDIFDLVFYALMAKKFSVLMLLK